MTAYFDQKQKELSSMGASDVHEFLRRFEDELVCDIDRATASPGFPEDIARAVDLLILTRCVYNQPVNRVDGPSPQSLEEHVRLLQDLVGDLHTQFHEIVRRGIHGFSHSPLAPMHVLQARAEERRENIVASEPAYQANR